jgi:hypothetical protein
MYVAVISRNYVTHDNNILDTSVTIYYNYNVVCHVKERAKLRVTENRTLREVL